MTREDKKLLEPALAPLRALIRKEDFTELALVYIQREKNYVIYSMEKDPVINTLYLGCYDVRDMGSGLVVITAEDGAVNVKKLMSSRPEYSWCHCLSTDDVDELLLWIQRDGEELRYKYRELTEKVGKALSFLNGRKYGWWEKKEMPEQ